MPVIPEAALVTAGVGSEDGDGEGVGSGVDVGAGVMAGDGVGAGEGMFVADGGSSAATTGTIALTAFPFSVNPPL